MSAEEYIAAIPMWTRKKNSLADIREFLAALNVSEKNIIHVAGTNGKGSVCAYLTSVLNASGYSTGTFVSPHLTDVKERFLLDGCPVGEADFTSAFERVLDVVRLKCGEGFNHPSYFEFCFLTAMTLFTEKEVDFTILETGLGGRLDATSSVNSLLACVITSISLDHTQYLGSTIEAIAAEKAGIIRPHVPVIYDAGEKNAAEVIAKKAEDLMAPAYPVSEGHEADMMIPEGITFTAPYHAADAALALTALEVLNIPGVFPRTIYEGLSLVHWQGRMEEIRPGIWLDGAHNPGGVSAFIEAVKEQEKKEGPFGVDILFAVSHDKDYHSMIHLLAGELSIVNVTVTAFEGERTADPDELEELFKKEGCMSVTAFRDPEKALAAAVSLCGENRRLYIVGSLYLIGAIRPILSGKC